MRKRRFTNKRKPRVKIVKPKRIPRTKAEQRAIDIAKIQKNQKEAVIKNLSFVDFLMLTASGDILMQEADDFLHKRHFRRKAFNEKVDRLAALHSGFEDLPVLDLPPPVRPTVVSSWKFDRKMPHYGGGPFPLPPLPISQKQSLSLIREVIDKDICRYRIMEYAVALLRLDLDFIALLLNEIKPGKVPFISDKRLTMLKRDHSFQNFYREGRRYYTVSVRENFVRPMGGDLGLFDHTSMNQLLPGFLGHSVEVSRFSHFVTNLVTINGRRFVDVHNLSGTPLRTVKL